MCDKLTIIIMEDATTKWYVQWSRAKYVKKNTLSKEMYRNLEPDLDEEPDAWQCCKLLECCECCLLWIYACW